MLAPLLDGTPVLDTYYPPAVLQYLQTVPVDSDASRGTRLDQLKAQWVQSGRLDLSGFKKTPAENYSSNLKLECRCQSLHRRPVGPDCDAR
jgi:hypothetical protein